MIEYNTIAYMTDEVLAICPIERREKRNDMTKIQLYTLLCLSQEDLKELFIAYDSDRREFYNLVKQYIETSPKNICS